MHWWQGAFVSTSTSKSQTSDDSVISSRPGFFSSRRNRLLRKLRQADADTWRSPSSSHNSCARSAVVASSVPPQPLPLPELSVLLHKGSSSSVPLPSPEAIQIPRGIIDDAQKSRYDTTHSSTRSTEKKKSLDCYTPISAPASPYSTTPMADLWASHYVTPPGIFQVWSAPEPHSDGPGFSFDNSPTRTPPRSTSPHTRWETTQATVHPLPLPPAYSLPMLPTPRSPVADFSSPLSPELKPINSKWQKGKLIGRGTFGSVYVASNRETGALCAMKEVEILPDDSKSAECMRQLEQEIKVLSHLKHLNIVQYYGSEIVGDKFYIYLEYVHPGSINKFINDHCEAITESVVRNFTRHILCGLAYLHSKKTIHRDIKGANLLVDAYGVVKLADFGMAKHLNGQTANLSLKGSPYWMAPELLQSAMQTDASSDLALAVDIWSLGCTIIEMMNGKPPWSEYEGAAALFKVLKETPPIPTSMSAEGKDFLQCCFRRNPADRPTASKLLDHPFVSYSQQPDACTQSLQEAKLSDSMQYLRERSRHKQDQAAPRPFDSQMKGGKLSNKYW